MNEARLKYLQSLVEQGFSEEEILEFMATWDVENPDTTNQEETVNVEEEEVEQEVNPLVSKADITFDDEVHGAKEGENGEALSDDEVTKYFRESL